MSLILEDYNVANGVTESSVLTDVDRIRVQAIPESTLKGKLAYYLEVKEGDGDWVPLRDEEDEPIQFSTKDSAQNSVNVAGILSSNLRIKVIPESGATGLVSIEANYE